MPNVDHAEEQEENPCKFPSFIYLNLTTTLCFSLFYALILAAQQPPIPDGPFGITMGLYLFLLGVAYIFDLTNFYLGAGSNRLFILFNVIQLTALGFVAALAGVSRNGVLSYYHFFTSEGLSDTPYSRQMVLGFTLH